MRLLTAIYIILILAGCARRGASGKDALSEAEKLAAAVVSDTMRTYAVAARCAELAYMGTRAPDSLQQHALASLQAYGVDIADSTILQLTDITAQTPGFKAVIFYDKPAMRHIIAYAGTELESADIITDINGAFSVDEPQNTAALLLLDSLVARLASQLDVVPDDIRPHILLTGHSLGGRLASVGCILGETDAVVFNPANIPVDLQKRVASEQPLKDWADAHLTRIHSSADELTGALALASRLTPLLPYISRAMDSGDSWLSDRSSLALLKGFISNAPEIAGTVDMLWGSESTSGATSAADITRIAISLMSQMRHYNVSTADLADPLFYTYAGRSLSLPYLSGGHSIAPLSNAIDSAYHANHQQ